MSLYFDFKKNELCIMNIVFLGPPGAGKGTQAQYLCNDFRLQQLSTGDILRLNIKQKTDLGKTAEDYIAKGELVPDNLIIDMIRSEIAKYSRDQGFLFDGFPRTISQAEALDSLLDDMNKKIDISIELKVPDENIIDRLSGRRICPICGATYHIKYNPPKVEGVCDIDGGELYQRKDDNPETIKNRLEVYKNQTVPIVNYYKKYNKLEQVNGVGELHNVYRIINEIVSKVN